LVLVGADDVRNAAKVAHAVGSYIGGCAMHDLTIDLDHVPGALAAMGEALGRAGVSIEGGGVFTVGGRGVAHFLFRDGEAARRALAAAGIAVLAVREPLLLRLRQGVPGQLGMVARRMAEAGVNIEVQYSDHDGQLVLLVDDPVRGAVVRDEWSITRA
jgi:hypothetical protein